MTHSPAPARSPLDWLALAIATWGGSGLAPRAPGTVGTLATVPLAWWLLDSTWITQLLVTVAISLIGWWAAHRVSRSRNHPDPQLVVVDEAAGLLLALTLAPPGAEWLLAAVVLFRIFDIWKPGPVGWLDRNLHGGAGIMADDLAAGALAGSLLALIFEVTIS